ncbi:MAG: hypothetical protein ACXW1Q_05165, partial [Halobacteriota archaeon]
GSSGWQNLGGVLTSSPGSTSKGDNIIDVFARGSGGGMAALWQRDYNNVVSGDWTVWTFVGQVGP